MTDVFVLRRTTLYSFNHNPTRVDYTHNEYVTMIIHVHYGYTERDVGFLFFFFDYYYFFNPH